MTDIIVLRPVERILHDNEAIAILYRNWGTKQAEKLVNNAIAELAMTMANIVAKVRQNVLVGLTRLLNDLEQMADQLGMISLGLVACDMRACLTHDDGVSFAAVWARLLRVADLCFNTGDDKMDQSR